MVSHMAPSEHRVFPHSQQDVISKLGEGVLLDNLHKMLLIRHFEIRTEAAYQQGKIGGFLHLVIGQEAVNTACVQAAGVDNWWIGSYRDHALALLLGATPEELMAELYGRANGNALGRGGSMHLYTERLLGGFGIVGGQIPIATGAAFTLKYQGSRDQIAICFFGDGAVGQGGFHESLNMASLWDLPCLYVIENNQWGMGTSVKRAICVDRLAEDKAPSFNMKGYTLDGMDFFACYAGFQHIVQEIKETSRPVLVEVLTERFRGHSISDPGLYRSKDQLKECMQRDPIHLMREALEEAGMLDEAAFKAMDKAAKEQVLEAMKYADESPWPDPAWLEEGVYAP